MNYERARRIGIPVKMEALVNWCEEVQLAALEYSRVRKRLWTHLTTLIRVAKQTYEDNPQYNDFYPISSIDWAALKSGLTSKQENLTDDKKLAIEMVVTELSEHVRLERGDYNSDEDGEIEPVRKKQSKEEKE